MNDLTKELKEEICKISNQIDSISLALYSSKVARLISDIKYEDSKMHTEKGQEAKEAVINALKQLEEYIETERIEIKTKY